LPATGADLLALTKGLDRRKDEYKQFSQWCKEFTQMRRRYLKKVENSERVA